MTPIRCFLLEPTGREDPGGDGPIYSRSDGGPETTWFEAPVGALVMMGGPDPSKGQVLMAKVPGNADGSGEASWCIDGRSRDNPAPAWQRTGTPPDITVTPSIFINPPNGWHGWLRGGMLVDA